MEPCVCIRCAIRCYQQMRAVKVRRVHRHKFDLHRPLPQLRDRRSRCHRWTDGADRSVFAWLPGQPQAGGCCAACSLARVLACTAASS